MEMSIDEIIDAFDYIKHVGNGEFEYKHCREEMALDEAVIIMRKYQQIEQIVTEWNEYRQCISCGFGDFVYMQMVGKVVENGNNTTNTGSN